MPPSELEAVPARQMRGRTALVHAAAVIAIGAVALTIMALNVPQVAPQLIFDRSLPAEASHPPPSSSVVVELHRARTIAPEVVAPPDVARLELERVEARPPLGDLGLAMLPKPGRSDDWGGTLLYRPVVTSSATFEAMGHVISIAGTEAIDPNRVCEFEGVTWRCGERAMLAFRYWLRGRAPLCQISTPAERQLVAVACRLGKQDVGAWLVSNGWALALPGGGYEKAEEVARKASMGVFGAPD